MIKSAEQFVTLVRDGGEDALTSIRNDIGAEAVWLEILDSRPELVREVTLNRSLPDAVFLRLAEHPDRNVRIDIANKRNLSFEIFETLATDEDESVRARVAWNKKTPKAILIRLRDDPESIVSEPARKQLATR